MSAMTDKAVALRRSRPAYVAARALLSVGVFPSPTVLNRALGRSGLVKMNNLNGRDTASRQQALEEAGYVLGVNTRRWMPPS